MLSCPKAARVSQSLFGSFSPLASSKSLFVRSGSQCRVNSLTEIQVAFSLFFSLCVFSRYFEATRGPESSQMERSDWSLSRALSKMVLSLRRNRADRLGFLFFPFLAGSLACRQRMLNMRAHIARESSDESGRIIRHSPRIAVWQRASCPLGLRGIPFNPSTRARVPPYRVSAEKIEK